MNTDGGVIGMYVGSSFVPTAALTDLFAKNESLAADGTSE
jgi:hypothetical protein